MGGIVDFVKNIFSPPKPQRPPAPIAAPAPPPIQEQVVPQAAPQVNRQAQRRRAAQAGIGANRTLLSGALSPASTTGTSLLGN